MYDRGSGPVAILYRTHLFPTVPEER
jgi:hypothetical protein